jgi:hypothetical protein
VALHKTGKIGHPEHWLQKSEKGLKLGKVSFSYHSGLLNEILALLTGFIILKKTVLNSSVRFFISTCEKTKTPRLLTIAKF